MPTPPHFTRLAAAMQLRRRLATMANATETTPAATVAAAAGSLAADADPAAVAASSGSAALAEEESDAFTPEQLMALRTSGLLAVSLYAILAVAILWMTVKHFRHGSTRRKRVFHVLLLTSVLFNLPDPLGWILWPETQSWVYTYPLRIYSVLLQSVCKSIISIGWSEVVSAGQSVERRRVTYVVMVFNSILFVWAVSVPVLLLKYPNDVDGQYDFMTSPLRAVVTYSGVGVIFIYGIILMHQGMRLRRRLLQAKGTVPIGSVEKSLNQLMLTVCVIVFSDLMRLVSLALNEASVDMPLITFVVCNSLVPNIFPTICMLYLMRRVGKKDASNSEKAHALKQPRPQHPRFLADDRESDLHNAPVLGMSKFSLPASRIASVDRVDPADLDPREHRRRMYELQQQQQQQRLQHPHVETSHQPLDSRGSTRSPLSHWVRE